MKFIKIFSVCLFCGSTFLKAQPPQRDTTMFAFNQAMSQAINAPILRGNSQGATIYAVRQSFCFDLTIDIDMFFGGHTSRQTTLFINTVDGYIGYTMPSAGGPITELIPEVENFTFTVVSFKLGNVFMYHNQKASRGFGIDHLVSTSNSDAHELQVNNTLVGQLFTKKGQVTRYCDGKASAVSYKIDGQQSEWAINGHQYPQTFKVEKFLGLFGVGIIRTNAGIFTIMELKSGTSDVTIKRIERRSVCFDPSGFKMQESDFYAKAAANLQATRDKINRDEEQAQRATCCIPERMNEIALRREQLRINEENLRKAQQGNLMQDKVAQKGMLDLMDPLAMVQGSILSTKTSICALNYGMAQHPETAAAGSVKLACLNQQLSMLTTAESQMRAAEVTYAGNIARVTAEKSKIMMTYMRQGGCN